MRTQAMLVYLQLVLTLGFKQPPILTHGAIRYRMHIQYIATGKRLLALTTKNGLYGDLLHLTRQLI